MLLFFLNLSLVKFVKKKKKKKKKKMKKSQKKKKKKKTMNVKRSHTNTFPCFDLRKYKI